ncbi:hypothetical protein [Lysobacter gummosus]|uniref:hypothetical protein n=1 Tax=Lysobacter gummosus TaxID=262324 RepID=UPI003643AC9F
MGRMPNVGPACVSIALVAFDSKQPKRFLWLRSLSLWTKKVTRRFMAEALGVCPCSCSCSCLRLLHFCSSFPRTRAPLYFGVAEHPETSSVLARKALDSRVRGNDGGRECAGRVVSIRNVGLLLRRAPKP